MECDSKKRRRPRKLIGLVFRLIRGNKGSFKSTQLIGLDAYQTKSQTKLE